jgi:Tol biopolymer transport system component
MALTPGVKLGVYEVLGLVGAGGMGEIYRARDTNLKREVAIKVLPAYVSLDPDRLRRFEQEAQAAAALNHPNILAIYQFGSFEGAPYIVSEILTGGTLRVDLEHGPLSVRKAIDYGVQIAHGLAAAHEKGIVHRDLKPENLFVTKDGRVKILDFGLAKLKRPQTEVDATAPTQAVGSEPGVIVGTAGYMSPEQVRGGEVDHRCDIFAFGATLYEMFSGKRAFQRTTSAETMTAILKEDPPAISQVLPGAPPGIQRVVHRCLEKNPEQRFQSASDLAFALEAISDSGLHSGPGAVEQSKSSSRWRWFGVAAVALAAAAAFVIWWRTSPPEPVIDSVVQLTNDGVPKPVSNIVTDGSRIYFTEGQPGSLRIAQVSVNGGPIALIETKVANPQIAALAPDGSSLLVSFGGFSFRRTMWSVPLPAGEPRRLGNEEVQDAGYFPDGRMVYFRDNALYSADADGTQPRRLASLDKVKGTPWRPEVSPDGKRIAFSSFLTNTNNNNSVFEIGSDGSDLREIPIPSPDDSQCCSVWMPDGKSILTTAGRGISGDIWLQPANSGLSPLHRPNQPDRLTNGELSYRFAIVRPSRDGSQIFAIGTKWRGELVRYDIKSKSFMPFLSGIAATDVTFSRDGRWLSYLSYPDHTLWRSRADGTDRMQLTYPPMQVIFPSISPDGTKVVFGDVQTKMHIISMDGGPLQRIGTDKGVYPTWSPDGNKLVFGITTPTSPGHANTFELRTFDLRTGKTSVISSQVPMMGAFWVTQDTLVAATIDSTKFRTFDPKTGKWSDLTSGSFVNWYASPDGQYLYFTTGGTDQKVMRIRFADHRLETIVPNLKDLRRVVDPLALATQINVAPDGSPIFTRDTGSQEIYALKLRWH